MIRLSTYKQIKVSGLIVNNCQTNTGLTIDAFEYARVENSISINNSPTYYDWVHDYCVGIVMVVYEQYPQLSKIEVVNCLIANNRNDCTFWGPGVSGLAIDASNGNADIDVINCTIAGNMSIEPHTTGFGTGGINYRMNVYNTLISGNTPLEAGLNTTLEADSAIVSFEHCLVTGGAEDFYFFNGVGTCIWGEGNLYTYPVYDSTSQYAYYPGFGSLTIDSGTANLPSDVIMPSTDLAGNLRVYNGNIDIGCYEYGSTVNLQEYIPTPISSNLSIYPNPFKQHTNISYTLEKASDVVLEVFNTKGQRVKKLVNSKQAKGEQVMQWDGKDEEGNALSSGVYIALLNYNGKRVSQKMILVK